MATVAIQINATNAVIARPVPVLTLEHTPNTVTPILLENPSSGGGGAVAYPILL